MEVFFTLQLNLYFLSMPLHGYRNLSSAVADNYSGRLKLKWQTADWLQLLKLLFKQENMGWAYYCGFWIIWYWKVFKCNYLGPKNTDSWA